MLNHPTTIGLKHNHAKENGPKNRRSHVLRQSLFSKNTLQASNSKLMPAPKDPHRINGTQPLGVYATALAAWQGELDSTQYSFSWEEQFRRIDDGNPLKKYLKCLF